jgi:hypothetical protein
VHVRYRSPAASKALNVTGISYRGHLDFGFTFDPELVPDPWQPEGIPIALEELKQPAGLV